MSTIILERLPWGEERKTDSLPRTIDLLDHVQQLEQELALERAKVRVLCNPALPPSLARAALAVGEMVEEAKQAGNIGADGIVVISRQALADRVGLKSLKHVGRVLDSLHDDYHVIDKVTQPPRFQKSIGRPLSQIRVRQPLALLEYLELCASIGEAKAPAESSAASSEISASMTPLPESTLPSPPPPGPVLPMGSNVPYNQLGGEGDGEHGERAEIDPDRVDAGILRKSRSVSGRASRQQLPPEPAVEDDPISFLLDVAGDAPEHIRMMPHGPDKYVTKHRPLNAKIVRSHLDGFVCVGATMGRQDGTTRSVTFDADKPEPWAILEVAARQLQLSGAVSVLAPSASTHHPGGGRLALYFDAYVDAGEARATALKVAPALASVKEYWPRGDLSVRLPGAYYSRDDVHGWCTYKVGDDPELYTGIAAMNAIRGNLTPASWVTERAVMVPESMNTPAPPEPLDWRPVPLDYGRPIPAAGNDPRWLQRYGATSRSQYFWMTASQVAAHFNATHAVAQILPIESNGMGRASWRDDTVPSVKLYLDTNTWCDFGDIKPNGKRASGDAIELYARVHNLPKSQVFRDAGKAMTAAATTELELAARDGRGPATWVAEITSPSGWRHYDSLAPKK